jgi:hypothetical protein
MRSAFRLTVLLILAFATVLPNAQAANYQFASVYDSSDGFDSFDVPAINDLGVVVFRASRNSESSILSGDGGPLTNIVSVGDQINGTSVVELDRSLSINNSGAVVFKARLGTGVQGIYLSSGGAISTIADTAGPFRPDLVGNFGVPDINNIGNVLFEAGLDAGGTGTFVASSNAITQVLDSSTSGSSLNDSGKISYANDNSVFLKDLSVITNLTNGMPGALVTIGAAINNSDQVAFGFVAANSRNGIAKFSAGTTTVVADTNGTFTGFSLAPGINDHGDLAFIGDLPTGEGIFTGSDVQSDRVIVQGDSLFGSTVSSLNFGFSRHGFNNRGQVAFRYFLTNGQIGIGVATPVPEPTTLQVFLSGRSSSIQVRGISLTIHWC